MGFSIATSAGVLCSQCQGALSRFKPCQELGGEGAKPVGQSPDSVSVALELVLFQSCSFFP